VTFASLKQGCAWEACITEIADARIQPNRSYENDG